LGLDFLFVGVNQLALWIYHPLFFPMKMASFGEGDNQFGFCFGVRIDWMEEFKQMGGVLIGLIFEADSGDEFFRSVERFFYV
jgi:hypothetical protein